jgi:hypothetical protein
MASLDASAMAALLVELGRRTALAGDNYSAQSLSARRR